ncbi:Type IV leader peptidase family protein [uncultured archaeon]|nr:Type IV leader peptidase family protein [uncultured archaeon]
MLVLIQEAILLAGAALGAITDARTGYIYDWITYPMIILGIILSILQQQWINLGLGAVIFAVLFVAYYFGKLGGGDVKLFAAIAFLNPQNDVGFLLTTVFVAAMSAMVFYPVYYSIKYARKGFSYEENKEGIQKALLFGAIIVAYFYFLTVFGMMGLASIEIIIVPLLFGLLFIALQKGITSNFFEKRITLKSITEEEVVAEGKNTKKIMDLLKGKKLIGEKEVKLLAKNGVNAIYVLRGLPPFGPFILLGVLVAIFYPDFVMMLFWV